MKEMFKKCSTDQRFIFKEITSLKIHTLITILNALIIIFFSHNGKMHLFTIIQIIIMSIRLLKSLVDLTTVTTLENTALPKSTFTTLMTYEKLQIC